MCGKSRTTTRPAAFSAVIVTPGGRWANGAAALAGNEYGTAPATAMSRPSARSRPAAARSPVGIGCQRSTSYSSERTVKPGMARSDSSTHSMIPACASVPVPRNPAAPMRSHHSCRTASLAKSSSIGGLVTLPILADGDRCDVDACLPNVR